MTRVMMFFAASLLVCSIGYAQGDVVENYLASAEQKATNVVNNAGTQGRGIAMEAGQAALNAIASFRAAYADSLRLSTEALNPSQADLFHKIQAGMALLDDSSRTATANLQRAADTLSAAVGNIPLSKDVPRVTRVAPLFSVEGSGPSRELVVNGIGLSNGTPVLVVATGSLHPNTTTDTELRFPLPSPTIRGRPLVITTTLRLFERKTKLLFFSSYVPHSYPIRLVIYPREIGAYTIMPRRRVPSVETQRKRTPEYRCDSPHGSGSSSVAANVVATPGWTIDVSSISYDRTYSNHGSFTMNTTSPAGFTATLSCSGWGRITGPLGLVIDAGSVGVEKGGFSYTEARTGTMLQDGQKSTRMLHWGEALIASDLPVDTETVILELRPFTGETLALEGGGHNRFLSLLFNPASKVVTVTAKGIEEALRQ